MRNILILTILMSLAWLPSVFAMAPDGCGAGNCADCHSITKQETEQLLGGMVDKVDSVEFSEVPGMWVAVIEKDEKKLPVFIDFSKKYLISGNVIRLTDMTNVTRERAEQVHTVDVSKIPLADALLVGSPSAPIKVIVFTDPQCPYCKKLHEVLKEAVQRDPEIAFLLKLFPLKIHPKSYDIAMSIVCNNSLEYLEKSYAGQPVPPPNCEIPVVDQTIALAQDLGIRSTPSLVMPNGKVVSGYRPVEALLTAIRENVEGAGEK